MLDEFAGGGGKGDHVEEGTLEEQPAGRTDGQLGRQRKIQLELRPTDRPTERQPDPPLARHITVARPLRGVRGQLSPAWISVSEATAECKV